MITLKNIRYFLHFLSFIIVDKRRFCMAKIG